jgi:hypothetical protein
MDSQSLGSNPTSVYNGPARGQYNRGVIERLPNPHEVLSQEEFSQLEEVQVTIEEPWNETIEAHLSSWLAEAESSGHAHKKSGFTLKRRYRMFMFVVLLWSAIILVVNDSIGCDATEYEQFMRLVINAVGVFFNALFSSLNLGYMYRMHFEYETKFYELSQDISFTLMRERDYRMPADAFMTEIRERRKKLALAPELTGKRVFGF